MKRYISSVAFLVAILFGVYNSVYADELTVCDPPQTTSNNVPLNISRANSLQRSQTIYSTTKIAAMSASGCEITGIRYYASSNITFNNSTVPTISVKLAEVDNASLTDFLDESGFTEVFLGQPQGKGTKELFFDFSNHPFSYSGSKNLIVQIKTTTTTDWQTIYFHSTTQENNVSYYFNHSNTYNRDYSGAYGTMPKTTFYYELPVTCPNPTDLTLSGLTPYSASFTWTAGDSETEWQYVCLPSADAVDWTDAAVQTTTSASALVEDLLSGTEYKFYVRAYCAADDQSKDVSLQFTTPCGAILSKDLPYTYGFASDAAGTIPTCWGRKPYVGRSLVYPSINTGYSKKDANCLYFSGGYSGTESTIILPEFEEPTNNLKISFYYYNGNTGTSYPQLKVGYMTDTTDLSTFVSVVDLTRRSTWGSGQNDEPNTGEIELTGAPANSYIAIQFSGGSYNGTAYIDNIVVAPIISCELPTDLSATNITSTGATISWTHSGNATYSLRYKVQGTDSWTVVSDPIYIATNTLTGLSSNTTYDFQVGVDCDGVIGYTSSASFTTLCGVYSLPFSEDFDDLSAGIPECWNNSEGDVAFEGYRFNYYATGHNATKCVSFNSFDTPSGQYNYLKTPKISIDCDAQLSFWYHNAQGGDFSVYYSVGNSNTKIALEESLPQTDSNNPWIHKVIPLPIECIGQDIRICFKGTSNNATGNAYINIDEVEITASCSEPNDFTVSNITPTSAEISWGGCAQNYNLRYRIYGSSDWTAVNNVSAPYTLTGLTENTTYEYQVQAYCNSVWTDFSDSQYFTTINSCSVYSVPFYEGFTGSNLPDCWDNTEGTTSYEGYRWNEYSSDGNNATGCARFNAGYYSTNGQTSYLASPYILLTEENQLKFYWKNPMGATYKVYIVSITGGVRTEIIDLSTTQTNWTEQTYDLTAYSGEIIRLFFYAVSNQTSNSYPLLDDVSIIVPPCAVPTGISLTATGDGGVVSWTDDGAQSWSVRYRTTTPRGEWTTIDNLTTPTYTITGLTVGTQYDIQVQSHCSLTRVSDWTSTNMLVPICAAPVGITVSNIGESTATINFPEQGDYWYRCVPAGDTPDWTNTYTGMVYSATTKVLTSLNAGLTICTDYDLYVRKVCDNEQYSEPIMVSFTTECGDFIFLDTEGDGLWKNAGNWSSLRVPSISNNAIIRRPATIDANTKAEAKSVIIDQTTDDPAIYNGQIIIEPQGELLVATTLKKQTGEATAPVFSPTVAADLQIQTSALGNGVLAIGEHTSENGLNRATVSFYTKACKTETEGWINQYIGTPFSSLNDVYVDYYGSYIYKFDPTMPEPVGEENDPRWVNVKRGTGTVSFWGYNLLRRTETPSTLALEGTLCPSENKILSMYYNGVSQTENVFANSWMAPIDITLMDEGFVNAEKTIYIFNAGSKRQALDFLDGASQTELPTLGTGDNTSPGQYIAMPVNSARWVASPELTVIPPMQAFSVFATDESASLTLDYEQMVFEPLKSMEITTATTPLRAPRQEENKPDILKITVADKDGNTDKLYLLVREDFTSDFDNGYDGRKMFGDPSNPQLYALTDAGMMSIVCDNKAEGTLIGFRSNESDTYTISFDYDGSETLYLNDMVSNISTLINNQNEYIFSPAESDMPVRFVISQKTENEALTGIDQNAFNNMPSGEVRKVLINGVLYIIKGKNVYHITGVWVK